MMKSNSSGGRQISEKKKQQFKERSSSVAAIDKSPNYADFTWLSNAQDFAGVIKLLDSLVKQNSPIHKVDLDIAIKAAQNLNDPYALRRVIDVRPSPFLLTLL